jgi:DNA-binding response OmpR family regulator
MAASPDPYRTGGVTLVGHPVRRGRRSGHWGAEVLLIGADPGRLLARRLDVEAHGYRVATADNAHRAVGLMVALRPDVVVVDESLLTWQAPACRRLRLEADVAGIPVVVLGHDTTEHATPATLVRHIEALIERQ